MKFIYVIHIRVYGFVYGCCSGVKVSEVDSYTCFIYAYMVSYMVAVLVLKYRSLIHIRVSYTRIWFRIWFQVLRRYFHIRVCPVPNSSPAEPIRCTIGFPMVCILLLFFVFVLRTVYYHLWNKDYNLKRNAYILLMIYSRLSEDEQAEFCNKYNNVSNAEKAEIWRQQARDYSNE